jgi:hypothetical protein
LRTLDGTALRFGNSTHTVLSEKAGETLRFVLPHKKT